MADILNGSRFGIVRMMKMANLWNFMGMYWDVNGNLCDLLCHATNMGSTMGIY